jgi:hypothetical protein
VSTMTKQNNEKKSNARRKLIPAIGMLTVSAMMLSSATYAWFTMSREVEVQNIQMTATVPEDIQISLGQIGTNATTAATAQSGKSLASSSGVLMEGSTNSTASDGLVHAPVNDWDWSNTADISAYYQFGKLIPASSTNGANIFFTPDADGVGKTVKNDAAYIKANGTTVGGAGAAESGTAHGNGTFKTTLYAFTDENDTWADYDADEAPTGYKQSVSWNNTYSDGYYVDIPVWFRTSSTAGAALKVEAYVIPDDDSIRENDAGEALYRAVRVAVLSPASQAGSGSVTPTGLLPVADGWEDMTTAAYGQIADSPFAGTSVNDWYGGDADDDVAVKAEGTLDGTRFDDAIYGPVTEYDPTNTVITLAAGEGTDYGDAVKAVIRVWLEGEDLDCWNDTAGQNWAINLKFVNGAVTGGTDISNTAATP